MSNQTEESAGSSTSPRPEVNPLRNPLLAEYMKRWSELYLATPPEKREEAVRELLQELEKQDPKPQVAAAAETSASEGFEHLQSHKSQVPENPSKREIVDCQACGHENPANYQFCGNCGGELISDDRWSPEIATHSEKEPTEYSAAAEESEFSGEGSSWERPVYEPPSNHNELSLFQRVAARDYGDTDFTFEPLPSSRPRIFIGLVLAVMILGLGYMAWRGMRAQDNGYAPPPPPPVTEKSNAASAENSPAAQPDQAASSQNPAAGRPEQAASSSSTSGLPKHKEAKQPSTEDEGDAVGQSAPLSRVKAERTKPQSSPPLGNGNEELSIAEQYLSGANGQRRNSAQAASWLWKSVAKHNGPATLLLADLYLKGDGVSKNCDQARLLLYAAARKGIQGAGVRLRNLQAFGCQ